MYCGIFGDWIVVVVFIVVDCYLGFYFCVV